MRKSVGQAPTAGEQTQQKPCRTSSDIGAELENHTVGRGPMQDQKGLSGQHSSLLTETPGFSLGQETFPFESFLLVF
jgi:hypothetical protein